MLTIYTGLEELDCDLVSSGGKEKIMRPSFMKGIVSSVSMS